MEVTEDPYKNVLTFRWIYLSTSEKKITLVAKVEMFHRLVLFHYILVYLKAYVLIGTTKSLWWNRSAWLYPSGVNWTRATNNFKHPMLGLPVYSTHTTRSVDLVACTMIGQIIWRWWHASWIALVYGPRYTYFWRHHTQKSPAYIMHLSNLLNPTLICLHCDI